MPISPKNFKNPRIRKRKTFEIIFDNCSSGRAILNSLEIIANHIEKGDVYENVIFTIPLQVGTEMNRRLFADFLEKSLLNSSRKHIKDFYNNNKDRINIVETNISLGYKLFYAKQAFSLLQDEQAIERILSKAQANIEGDVDLEDIRQEYDALKSSVDEVFDKYNKQYRDSYKKAVRLLSELEDLDSKSTDIIKKQIKTIETKVFARASKELFSNASDTSKRILQEMYMDNSLHKSVNEHGRLKKYRKDKGERAIEDYLVNERDKVNDDIVTLVVSDDRKAVNRVSSLRKSTQNIIVALRDEGLKMLIDRLVEKTDMGAPKEYNFSSNFKNESSFQDEVKYSQKMESLISTGKYSGNITGLFR